MYLHSTYMTIMGHLDLNNDNLFLNPTNDMDKTSNKLKIWLVMY